MVCCSSSGYIKCFQCSSTQFFSPSSVHLPLKRMVCVMSYHIMPYHITQPQVISYHIISYHVISCHIMSYHITHHQIKLYHIISYHVISYSIISHHVISSRPFSSGKKVTVKDYRLLETRIAWATTTLCPRPIRPTLTQLKQYYALNSLKT